MTSNEGAEPKQAKRSGTLGLLILFGVMPLVAWGAFELVSSGVEKDFEAQGELVAKGTAHGDFTVKGGKCLTGERRDFEGIYVRNENGGGFSIATGATGPLVRVQVPGTCDGDGKNC